MVVEDPAADYARGRINRGIYQAFFIDGSIICQYNSRTYYNIEFIQFNIYISEYLGRAIKRCLRNFYVFS